MTDGSKRSAKAMARHCLSDALSDGPLGRRAGLLALWLVAWNAGFLDRPTTAAAEPPISVPWTDWGEPSSLTPRTVTVGLNPSVDAGVCGDWGIVDPGTIVDIRPLPPIPGGDPIHILPAPPAVDPVPPAPPPSGPSHDLSIYLSEVGSIGSGLALDNPIQHYPQVGESGSLFVWMAPGDAQLIGAGLNVVSSNPGVLSFSGANVLNPDIFAPRPDDPHAIVPRWQGAHSGKVSGDAVTGMAGAIVTEGLGVSGSYDGSGPTGALDPLLDPDTGSLLFAEINYDVIGEGSTDLFLQIGEIGINAVDSHSRQSEVYFGAGENSSLNGYTNRGVSSSLYDARVNVGAGPFDALIIPEPDQLVTEETDAEGEGLAGLDEDPIVGNLDIGTIDTVTVTLHTDGDSTHTSDGSTYIASTFDDSPNSWDTFIGAPLGCEFDFTTGPELHLTSLNDFPNAAAPVGAGADGSVPEPGGFMLALSLLATIGLATGGRRRL